MKHGTVKRILKYSGFAIAFLVSSIVILAFLVDANIFKPRIEALAQQQGIALNMRGDLHWAFWPAIGIAVQDVSVADIQAPADTIAHVQKASFLMAFIPLMRGDFEVKHVLVDTAAIELMVNEQGVGNWEALTKSPNKAAAAPAKTSAEVSSEDLELSIEQISLKNSTIHYVDKRKDQRLTLSHLDLDMNDVNLNGDPFAMTLAGLVEFTQPGSAPVVVKARLSNSVALGQGFNSVALSNGELKLNIGANTVESLDLKYSVKLSDIKTNLLYQGDIAVSSFNAKKLLAAFAIHPKMANEKALGDVSLTANFSGDKKHIALDPLTLVLDKTRLKGSVAITDFASSALAANLQGDEIIVDDYLAPTAADKAPAANIATGNETLLPLDSLRKLNADIKANFTKIVISDLTLGKIQFDVNAKNGLILQQLNASAYAGNIHEKITLDARGQTARTNFDFILQGLEIAPILKDKKMDKKLNLSGAVQANANGQASGVTKNQIMETLVGNANFSGAKIRLAPINIEQQFCKLITLVNKSEEPVKTWDAFTELRELSGKITIAKRVITVDSINAGVEKLLLGTNGNINLVNGTYDFSLPLKLIRDADDTPNRITTSKDGCVVNSNYWAERSMSLLRCKGAYAEIDPKNDCRPDKDALVALTKDYAEYKLREKYGEKIDAKKSELQKKLNDKLGEGGSEKAKNLLKNLFKKNDDK